MSRPLALALILSLAGPACAGPVFVDRAAAAGLDFVHFNGMSGQMYLAENLGGGAALLDYDNDGDLDLYLTQGRMLGPGKTLEHALFPPPAGTPLIDRLYRNDSAGPRLRFTDVTEAAGIHSEGYAMGVAAGDYDNDGYPDLYVTNLGANRLLHNNGDGSFTDVTGRAGVGDARFSVSAAFLDYDRDGWLDLFVADYVDFDPGANRPCYAPSSARDYCSPKIYEALADRLYRNRGDGSFEDVSAAAGIAQARGTALGVVVADLNADAWPDIYVANDGLPNHQWINQGDGSFRDEGLLSGTAVNMQGKAEASMGVDAADFDGDGDEDLFMTHLKGETNTLYVNSGQGWFEDRTTATGLGPDSKPYTSFGTGWLDYDNDADLDLFVANGAVNIILSLVKAEDPYPLHQPNQLFENLGEGRFRDVSAQAGPELARSEVSRGAAFGDVDNDGDTDVVVANNNGPVRLLINQVGAARPWLGLRLIDSHGRDALGARVAVRLQGGRVLWRRARSDASYASASDPRILVGLGGAGPLQVVDVHWPDGQAERWDPPPLGRYSTLRQGGGRPLPAPGGALPCTPEAGSR